MCLTMASGGPDWANAGTSSARGRIELRQGRKHLRKRSFMLCLCFILVDVSCVLTRAKDQTSKCPVQMAGGNWTENMGARRSAGRRQAQRAGRFSDKPATRLPWRHAWRALPRCNSFDHVVWLTPFRTNDHIKLLWNLVLFVSSEHSRDPSVRNFATH